MTTTAKHLAALERHLSFLKERINTWAGSDAGLAFAKRERNALLWAMPILRAHLDVADQTTLEQWEVIAKVAESEIGKLQQRQRERQAVLDVQFGMAPDADPVTTAREVVRSLDALKESGAVLT